MIHPLTRHRYELAADGTIEVFDDDGGRRGRFDAEGRHLDGDLRTADPHMCVWMCADPVRARRRAREAAT